MVNNDPPDTQWHKITVRLRNDLPIKMKKYSLVFGIALVALIAIFVYRHSHKNTPSPRKYSGAEHATPRGRPESNAARSHKLRSALASGTTDSERDKEDIRKLRRDLETARAKLEKITRPLGKDILSSTVNAEIKPGETLVTGGYRTADGNYELTLITPRGITLEDGREAIEVNNKILSVGSEFVEAHGLETLATNARNTLQHAEAWMQDDVARTLAAASDAEGVGILSSPKVITLPSTSFTLSMGEKDGAQFSFEGTVARSPSGSFAIQARVERTPKAEQIGDG